MNRLIPALLMCLTPFSAVAADETLDYEVTDPDHKVVRLDSAPTESFLAVKLDTEGRIFVGGREALFVYEPLPGGKYAPRKELLHFPDHTWVYDVEIRGNDLYLLTVSALYVVPEGRVKREGLQVHRLVWGVPLGHVHQCFHGLTFGPEGDLYFAMGDPLWYYGDFSRPDHWGHWTMFSKKPGAAFADKDWARTPYTGVGAVFKCKPDGSDLQVFARGLRNSCGLCFDHDWNLFTNDNDHESMPSEYVPGRLNHVTPHADFSWPRGWMKTKTPDRADLLDTMNTNLGRFVPVGQSYYDDPFLGEQYRHSLLVARWCTRKITYYPLKRKGTTFECEEKELLVGRDQARPVGVTVGRGGRIFATICYMAQNEGSPVYKSDLVMITRKDDPEGAPFEAYNGTTAGAERLHGELADDAWSRRLAAHQESLRRIGSESSIVTKASVKQDAKWFRRKEIAYYLFRAATRAGEKIDSPYLLQELTSDASLLWFARMGELRITPDKDGRLSLPLLEDVFRSRDLDLQAAILGALLQSSLRFSMQTGDLHLPLSSEEGSIRIASSQLLAQRSSLIEIRSIAGSDDVRLRRAGVLATGFRLTRPESTGPLPEGAPLVPWRTDEAYVIQFADEKEKTDLRTLGPVGVFTTAEHWKALKHTEEQEQLFATLLARLDDSDEPARLQAAFFLSLLNDPRSEPKVVQVRTDTAKRRLGVAGITGLTKAWVVGPFGDHGKGFETVHAPEKESLDPSREFDVAGKTLAWREVAITRQVNFREMFGPCDGSSGYVYFRLESATKQAAELAVGSDDGIKVWQNGSLVWTNDVSRGALPLQDSVLVELQPGSNDFLIRVRNHAGESGLYVHHRSLSRVSATLPEKLGASELVGRLKAAAADAGNTKVDPKFLDVDWSKAAAQGDAEKGRKLFGSSGLGCAKCHAATADATLIGGPSLADARKRFTAAYLVESVLLPAKQLSPVFKATVVATKDGKTHTGLVVGETAEKIEILLTDASRMTIPTSEIDEKKLQDLSPMPAGLVKTPEELRDLLAYLLSENPKAP